MTRFPVLGAALCCLSSPTLAQQEIPLPQPIRIVITKVDCSRLIRHMPSADVAYQPGIDAQGRAVAPADAPGSATDALPGLVPDVLEFPITINPVGYGARNQAQRDKAAALQGSADTHAGKTNAQARIAALNAQKSELTAKAATLTTEKATLTSAAAAAASTLATLQAEVDAGTRKASDRTYVLAKQALPDKQQAVTAKQAEIDTNAARLTATTSAIAGQQSIVDAAPGKSEHYAANQAAAEAKLATLSSRGLDNTTMNVGTVRYDMARGLFTFNGEPIGGAEQQELARACARRGVR